MGSESDGTEPSLQEKLAMVEMSEGEDEAPTLDVGDPAPGADAAPDMAQVRAEVGRLREQAGELLAALERLEARLG